MAVNTNFEAEFGKRLNALLAETGPSVWIRSGVRSYADQLVLWLRYKAGGNLAARPGTSNHERGLAADLAGDLAHAHLLASKYGLWWPIRTENWHIESNGKPVAWVKPQPKKEVAVAKFVDACTFQVTSTGVAKIDKARAKIKGTYACAKLLPDGSVQCEPEVAYVGGVNGQAYFKGRIVKGIKDNGRGGYKISATSGEIYNPQFNDDWK